MRFRVLGPVNVSPRTPTAGKVRVVLAVLLIRANETVSTECLIDELWDNSPPRTAATTLQVYISQLRRILAEGDPPDAPQGQRLTTVAPGYCLRADDDEVDLMRFESLHRAGKAAYERGDFTEASDLLREGLGLWSGEALSGIPHGYTLSGASVRLNEIRMTVLEQRITADLRLGRHKELVSELMALVSEHPLRETLYAHLMVALFRSGRQSDALRTFAKARKGLVDELGIEPGPGLRHLHERILRSDANLAWREPAAPAAPAPPPTAWLPPALADFVGREDAVAAAQRTIAAAGERSPARLLVVSGRAGVGKSAFAVELARRSGEHFPDGGVFVRLRSPEGAALSARQATELLAQRLEAGRAGPEPAGQVPDPADRLKRLVRGRRMMVILDDASGEEQVRPLLAALPDAFVVVTARRALAGLDAARHLVLEMLQPKEAQQLLEEIVGARVQQDPEAALEIARLCGYLPLGLRVAGAALAARPHWTVPALAQRLRGETSGLAELVAGDLDVRAGLAHGYLDADPGQRWAFRTLALAPAPSFPLWSAAAALGTSAPEAERIVDELVQSFLMEVRQQNGGSGPRYSLHRLLRALALDLLAQDDPDTVTAALERLGEACVDIARYADAQLTPGRAECGPDGSEPPVRDPARAAEAVGSNPVLWFQEECAGLVDVLRRAHANGLWPLVWRLAESLSGYFEARAAWDEWAETHELALDAARREGDTGAQARVLRSLGDLAWQQHRCRDAGRHFEDARALFRALDDRIGAARCTIGLGDVTLSEGEPARAAKIYGDALAQCEEFGDARGRADALRGLAIVELQCGRAEPALDAFTAFGEEAEQIGDRRWAGFARRTKAWILEQAPEWRGGQTPWVPRAVEARPGIWVVAGDVD